MFPALTREPSFLFKAVVIFQANLTSCLKEFFPNVGKACSTQGGIFASKAASEPQTAMQCLDTGLVWGNAASLASLADEAAF